MLLCDKGLAISQTKFWLVVWVNNRFGPFITSVWLSIEIFIWQPWFSASWEQTYSIEKWLATLSGLFGAPSDSAPRALCLLVPSVRPWVRGHPNKRTCTVVIWIIPDAKQWCKRRTTKKL